MSGLYYSIELDDAKFQRDTARVKRTFGAIGDTAVAESNRIDDSFRKMAAAAAGFFTLKQAADFSRKMIQVRSEVEALEISFQTLVGNKEKADALFSSIREFAVNTPMMLNGLAKGAQTLLSFNIEADKVMTVLKQIGDISMGNQQRFDSLVLAFSQMSSTGKLMGQDLLQMINAGFNPLATISEKTGKSIAQLKDEMSAGAITSEMVAQAFADATAEGGKFHGMLEKQSKGLSGSISNLKGAIDDMFNDIGTKSQSTISSIIQGATDIVRNYEKVGNALAVLIAGYGSYKAAVIATNLAMKAAAFSENIRLVGMFRKELGLLKAAQQAFNLTAMKNPYIVAASAIIATTVAISKLVKSKREEKQAIIDSTKEMREEYTQTNMLVGKLKNANIQEEERKRILEQLRAVNPDIVRTINDESTAYERLNEQLEEYNKRQLAAIAVKQYSKKEDFEGAVDELMKARDEMQRVEADMVGTWSDMYNRYLGIKNTDIPQSISELMESLETSTVTEAEKVEAVFAAWRAMRERINTSQGRYSGYKDGRQELQFLIGNLSDDDYRKTANKLNKLESVYRDKAEALKSKIQQIAASVYTTDENARQDFINAQMALYFPETPKTQQIVEQPTPIKNITQQIEEAKLAVEALEKEIDELRSGRKTKDATGKDIGDFVAEISAREKALKEAREKLSTLTGQTEKQQAQDNYKTAQLQQQLKKEAKALQQLREDLVMEGEQAEINAMEEGFAKKMAQRELNHKKELVELERQRKDYLETLQTTERTKWEADNPDWKEKGLTFSPTVTALPADVKRNFDNIEEYLNNVFQQGNERALSEALEDYLTYEQRKTRIYEYYERERQALMNDDGTFKEGVTQDNINVLYKREKDAINAVNKEMRSVEDAASRMFQNVFGNVSKKTKEQILEAIAYAKGKLATLGDDEDPKDVETWVNQIEALEDELMNRKLGGGASTDWTDIVTNFAKIYEYRKRMADASDEERENIQSNIRLLQEMNRQNLIAAGGVSLANALGKAADTMREIAQLTGDADMESYAEGMEAATNVLSSAAQGFASGGWIGAIVGGVSQLFTEVMDWSNKNFLAAVKLKQAGEEYRQAVEMLQYSVEKSNSVFGNTDFSDATGLFWKFNQSWADILKYYKQAYSLLAEDYGSWNPATGYDLGWNYNLDKIKAFYNAYKNEIDSTARSALERLIAAMEAAEQADEMLNEIVSNYVGGIADQLADAIFEGVKKGSDAWDIFKSSAASAIENIGKQMLKDLIISQYLDGYSDMLKEAFASQDKEEIISVMTMMISGLGENMEEYKDWVEEYYRIMHEHGIEEGREGLNKGIASASQDSIDEVNGRMTAIQGHTFAIAENSGIIADNIRMLTGISNEILNHLAGIHDHTGTLVTKIDRIENDMSVMKTSLNDIALKGIKVK